MQGWRVASQYGPNERVERASEGHIEKQPNIRAWRLILSIFTQREIDRSEYSIYTQKHLQLHTLGLSTWKKDVIWTTPREVLGVLPVMLFWVSGSTPNTAIPLLWELCPSVSF